MFFYDIAINEPQMAISHGIPDDTCNELPVYGELRRLFLSLSATLPIKDCPFNSFVLTENHLQFICTRLCYAVRTDSTGLYFLYTSPNSLRQDSLNFLYPISCGKL